VGEAATAKKQQIAAILVNVAWKLCLDSSLFSNHIKVNERSNESSFRAFGARVRMRIDPHPVRRNPHRQTKYFFQVSNPTSLRDETEFILNPSLISILPSKLHEAGLLQIQKGRALFRARPLYSKCWLAL
jgi:hypothetical protein